MLRAFLDYGHQEIGETLGSTANASEVRPCPALKQLRAALSARSGERLHRRAS